MTAQLVVTAAMGLGAFLLFGMLQGVSVVYGGLVDLVLTLLLSRNVRKADAVAATDPKGGMTVLYVGAVQRFFLFIAMFAVGLALLRLDALAVATGFVAARIAQLASARDTTRTNDEEGLK
ncbi:MAG TPA: ATP synthase subunit I [Thiobacillaceae bacterium]